MASSEMMIDLRSDTVTRPTAAMRQAIAAAPVGTYAPNRLGLYDMSGNVAEWINDFYEIPAEAAVVDPLGPETGEYHVIRGSSWMHGTITDLRISFRDYGLDGRQDVGFRVARFAEPN